MSGAETSEAKTPKKTGCLGYLLLSVLILLVLRGFVGSNSTHEDAAKEVVKIEPQQDHPTVAPPRFRLYRFSPDGISYVVPNDTTDEQLKSLLWLFREKVRAQRFRDIGITQPTSKHWGKKDYVDGILFIYRGQKCANELFIDSAGPCGSGEHDDASFQWGFATDANSALDPKNDEAAIRLANGSMQTIFNHKDGWQPTPSK